MSIRTSVEGARGCGYRKPGGLYLVSGGLMDACDALPIALPVCPTCGCGTKPTRGWTWVTPDALLEGHIGPHGSDVHSAGCPLGAPGRLGEKCGLLWIGESFYSTPREFTAEALRMGVSRRITAVPRGFVIGETWVLVAHRKAVLTWQPDATEPGYTPGIFHAFRPTAVEYIVKEDDDQEKLDALEARGISLVRVVREEQEALT